MYHLYIHTILLKLQLQLIKYKLSKHVNYTYICTYNVQ